MMRAVGAWLTMAAVAAGLAGCAGGRLASDAESRWRAAPPPAGETDLDREWRRYRGVYYEPPPPRGAPAPRFTFGFGKGTPQQLYFD